MGEARKNLLSSISYHTTGLRLELFRKVDDFLTNNNLTRKAFAENLGVSKGYISQVLNGDADVRISKLVQLSLAIGLVPIIQWVPLERYLAVNGKEKLLITSAKEINYEHPTTTKGMLQRSERALGVPYKKEDNYREIITLKKSPINPNQLSFS